MSIDIDFSELTKLVADLNDAPRKVIPKVVQALHESAKKVQEDWREPLKGSEYVPGGAGSVTYDVEAGGSLLASAITAEVGPRTGGPGSLVAMLEYGTPTTGPRGYGAEALRRNEAAFERAVGDAAEDAF
jgi:hypothetical protein